MQEARTIITAAGLPESDDITFRQIAQIMERFNGLLDPREQRDKLEFALGYHIAKLLSSGVYSFNLRRWLGASDAEFKLEAFRILKNVNHLAKVVEGEPLQFADRMPVANSVANSVATFKGKPC